MNIVSTILVVLVALLFFYIMYLETFATDSESTSRVFNIPQEELKRKTDELERQLTENPSQVFQIDTIGARRALEREMRNQKENTAKFETKNGTENVKIIKLDDKDLKNGNEIENNDNSTEINKKN